MNNNEQLNSNGNKRGMNANSQNNLKPNRNGRLPAKISLTSLTKRELERVPTIEEDGFDGKGQCSAWWIARNQVRDARNGDRAARAEILERTEGKVTQPVDAFASVEFRDAVELTDEQLAIIAAQNIIRNNALKGSGRTIKET